MAKAAKNLYACGECGATAPKWQGQCPGCGAWNTLVETRPEPAATGNRFAALAGASRLQSLAEVEAREEDRLPTGIAEFDRALGGGLVALQAMAVSTGLPFTIVLLVGCISIVKGLMSEPR